MTDEMIYVCNCGCRTHYIHSSGMIECANCATYTDQHTQAIGEFVKVLPPADPETEKTDAGTINVVTVGVEFAARRTIDEIVRWQRNGELMVVAAYKKNGAGKHWINVQSQDDLERVIGLMSEMLEFTKRSAVT